MQINHTSTNFGSIKLSEQAMKGPLHKLTKDMNDFGFQVFGVAGKDVAEIRNKMRPNQMALAITGQDGFRIIGHNHEDENFVHMRLKATKIDPEAELIADAPKSSELKDPNGPNFVLLG